MQLDMDNVGRMQGNKYYLKGKLYEARDDVSCDDCERMVHVFHEKGLYICYESGEIKYVQDPFHLRHNTITGNMSAESIYPPPSTEDIGKWEQLTGESLTQYERRIFSVNTDKIHSSPKDKDKDKGKDKDKDQEGKPDQNHFEVVWRKYPNQDGKKAALKHYIASVKTDEDRRAIEKALDNYLRSDRVKHGYIKNGSTWFNNWRDWIDYVEPKKDFKTGSRAKKLREIMRG